MNWKSREHLVCERRKTYRASSSDIIKRLGRTRQIVRRYWRSTEPDLVLIWLPENNQIVRHLSIFFTFPVDYSLIIKSIVDTNVSTIAPRSKLVLGSSPSELSFKRYGVFRLAPRRRQAPKAKVFVFNRPFGTNIFGKNKQHHRVRHHRIRLERI